MTALSYPNLFNAQTTNANSPSLDKRNMRHYQGGNLYTLHVYGTWDGATVKFQASVDNTNWIDITNASYTADKVDNLVLNTNFLRAVLSGAGASTSLSAHLK